MNEPENDGIDLSQLGHSPKLVKRPHFFGLSTIVTLNSVLGYFANWAVRQSPYTYPDNLGRAINSLNLELKAEFTEGVFDCKMLTCDALKLEKLLLAAFDRIPTIRAWNIPKKGNHQHVSVSAFSTPHPDYDFIDLHALARNIAQSVLIEALLES